MKKLIISVLALLALTTQAAYAAGGFAGEPFQKVVYVCGTTVGTGDASGRDASNCKPFADTDLWAIPAKTLISRVYSVITTAITGTTDLDVGDDDDQNGFIDGSLSLTLGTPGMYGWDAKVAGGYLRVETAGASDATDIYVVPSAKYYSAAGKEVKLDITTANTAGAIQVVIEGYRFK